MIKDDENQKYFNKNINLKNNIEIENIKTTNVNILLNRVRLDQKKVQKKRIIFSLTLISLVSFLAAYFII